MKVGTGDYNSGTVGQTPELGGEVDSEDTLEVVMESVAGDT